MKPGAQVRPGGPPANAHNGGGARHHRRSLQQTVTLPQV